MRSGGGILVFIKQQALGRGLRCCWGYMRTCLSVFSCAYVHRCIPRTGLYGVGGKVTDGLQPSPLWLTPLLPFTSPSFYLPSTASPLLSHTPTHPHTHDHNEKPALTAVGSAAQHVNCWVLVSGEQSTYST